jgi:hypothetical protein
MTQLPRELEQAIEFRIVRRTIQALLKEGYWIAVNDPEADLNEEPYSKSLRRVLGQMFTTDDDTLLIKRSFTDAKPFAWVTFIYGNVYDVVHDHTTNISDIMEGIYQYSDHLRKYMESPRLPGYEVRRGGTRGRQPDQKKTANTH